MIRKLAAYVILGINMDGMKEVLSIEVGDNESSKYWLSVLNNLKNRGVKDINICNNDSECSKWVECLLYSSFSILLARYALPIVEIISDLIILSLLRLDSTFRCKQTNFQQILYSLPLHCTVLPRTFLSFSAPYRNHRSLYQSFGRRLSTFSA